MKGRLVGTKASELREVIGKTVTENHSPTNYAKLIKINNKTCIMEVVDGSTIKKPAGPPLRYWIPLEHAWNAYFF
jgi:hypothetical protein